MIEKEPLGDPLATGTLCDVFLIPFGRHSEHFRGSGPFDSLGRANRFSMCNVFDVYTNMCKIVPILLPLFGSLWAHGTASGCLNGYNLAAGDAHKPPKSGRGSNRADAKSGHCQMERKCENQPISPHGHSAAKSILRGCPQAIWFVHHTSYI